MLTSYACFAHAGFREFCALHSSLDFITMYYVRVYIVCFSIYSFFFTGFFLFNFNNRRGPFPG